MAERLLAGRSFLARPGRLGDPGENRWEQGPTRLEAGTPCELILLFVVVLLYVFFRRELGMKIAGNGVKGRW